MLKQRLILSSLSALLIASSFSLAFADSVEFIANDKSKRDFVTFTSDAPLEAIQGNTNKIQGVIKYDDSFIFDKAHPFDIRFEVDLASVDTGIPLRNQHMRDNYLMTSKYPKAVFVAKSVKTDAKPPFKLGQKVKLIATGDFTVHGVTVQKTIPIDVTYYPESKFSHQRYKAGNMIRLKADFPVALADHNIEVPQALFYKLTEVVDVHLDLTATDNASASGITKPF